MIHCQWCGAALRKAALGAAIACACSASVSLIPVHAPSHARPPGYYLADADPGATFYDALHNEPGGGYPGPATDGVATLGTASPFSRPPRDFYHGGGAVSSF
jgi:hypothetical protein